MIGITLTPERIRAAPVEVRRWIERELSNSLGLRTEEDSSRQQLSKHLVACTLEEADAVLSSIQGMFPVVGVFFELGRQGISLGSEQLQAFRLTDIVKHTRLPNASHALACLDIINEAIRRVRADASATLYVLDNRGDCIVATQTQQSISRLWEQVIGSDTRGTQADLPLQQAEKEMSPPISMGDVQSAGRFDAENIAGSGI
ncbi:MAG TPA: hypothetical protein VE986_10095 [Hyphomicrobiales bacterium]|nr:hypothetical protein [Hyphomicrobiales bacterium]